MAFADDVAASFKTKSKTGKDDVDTSAGTGIDQESPGAMALKAIQAKDPVALEAAILACLDKAGAGAGPVPADPGLDPY